MPSLVCREGQEPPHPPSPCSGRLASVGCSPVERSDSPTHRAASRTGGDALRRRGGPPRVIEAEELRLPQAGSLGSTGHDQKARVSWGTTNDPWTCRLSDFGDVLMLNELAIVLRTSPRTLKRRLRAGTLPIPTPAGEGAGKVARRDSAQPVGDVTACAPYGRGLPPTGRLGAPVAERGIGNESQS